MDLGLGLGISNSFMNQGGGGAASSYCDEFQAVYDYWTIKPSDAVAEEMNTWVSGLVDAGLWETKAVRYVFAAHTNDNGEALVNWRNPGTHNAQIVNEPVFTAFEGFKCDADSYIDTNFNPYVNDTVFTQNSNSIGIYIRDNVVDSADMMEVIFFNFKQGNQVKQKHGLILLQYQQHEMIAVDFL